MAAELVLPETFAVVRRESDHRGVCEAEGVELAQQVAHELVGTRDDIVVVPDEGLAFLDRGVAPSLKGLVPDRRHRAAVVRLVGMNE